MSMSSLAHDILEHSLQYQRLGWNLLPLWSLKKRPDSLYNEDEGQTSPFICTCFPKGVDCGSPGKHPCLKSSILGASNDESRVRDWFSLGLRTPEILPDGIGVATGERSGIIVLDIESRGKGLEDLQRLRGTHGDHWFDETRSSMTGSGGLHFFYRCPPRFGPSELQPHGLHFDVLAEGSHAVLPPTLHYLGRQYQWQNDNPILDCPPWLMLLVQSWRSRRPARPGGAGRDISSVSIDERIKRCRLFMEKVEPAVNGGGGYKQTQKACGFGHEFGLTADQFWPILVEWNARCTSASPGREGPWNLRELRRKLEAIHDRCTSDFGWRLAEAPPDRPPQPPMPSGRRRVHKEGPLPPDPFPGRAPQRGATHPEDAGAGGDDPWAGAPPPDEPPPPDAVLPPDDVPPERLIETLFDAIPRTDLGNAERLCRDWGEDMRWVDVWGKWVVWNPSVDMLRVRFKRPRRPSELIGRWAVDDGRSAELFMAQVARALHEMDRQIPEDEQKSYRAFVRSSEGSAGITKALNLMKSFVPSVPDDWDQPHYLLNCPNGTLDLRTLKLRPPSRDDFITKVTSAPWDPQAECPTFMRFLDQVMCGDEELMLYLQRAIGYSLTGSTEQQCLWINTGEGGNGKGTFLNLIYDILGGRGNSSYGKVAPMSTFVEKKGDSIPNDIAMLRGSRLVIAQEKSRSRVLDEAIIKTLTGEDPVTARFLNKEFFTYQPTFKIWLAINGLPHLSGDDDAIWRRVRNVRWLAKIPDSKKDMRLGTKLREEASGILRWAAEGAVIWKERGLDDPQTVRQWTRDWRRDEDIVGFWLDERCVVDPDRVLSATALYQDFRQYVISIGKHPLAMNTWSERMLKRQSIVRTRTPRGVQYKGVSLRKGDWD